MLVVKFSWLRIYLSKFQAVPSLKEGEWGDYHTIVWMWFYIVLGRKLNELESVIQRFK